MHLLIYSQIEFWNSRKILKSIFVMLKAFQNLKFLLINMQETGESLDTMGTDRVFCGP